MVFYCRYLVADAAGAIRNGFQKVFGGEAKFVMCYFHMRKNSTKKIDKLFRTESKRKDAKADIYKLHFSPDVGMFNKGVKLFEKKWKYDKEFLD